MLLSRFRRLPLAAVAMAFLVLLVDWACHADRPVAPDGSGAGPAPALGRASAKARHDSVGLHYVCANRFRIRSRNDSALVVRWVVAGTADSGAVTVPGRPAGTRYSETYLDVPDSGTVQLFENGVRIAEARNRGRVCDTRLLAVRVDPGVIASGAARDSAYAEGSVVPYSFAAAPGYTHVLVLLDDSLVPASGSVTMGSGHLLWAAADVDVALPGADDPWVVELRSLLTAADPVVRYQQILNDVGSLYDAVGTEEAGRRIRLAGLVAYDLIRDSAAIVRVDRALALHEFVLGGSAYGGGGGGGVTIANRAPAGAGRDVAPGLGCTPQRPPEVPGTAEPTRVVYVNGINTAPDEAARTAHALRCQLLADGQLTGSTILFRTFYNRTWSEQLTDDVRRNASCIAAGMRWSGLWSVPTQIVAFAACKASAGVLALRTNDYIEAVRQYAAVLGISNAVEEDADSLARYLARHRHLDGEHMIVMAHSQGNLLTQQALQVLRSRGRYDPRRDSLCIGVVSVAAPTSSNWQMPTDYLIGLQASGDLLSLVTQRNHFPVITTPYSDSTAALIAQLRGLIASAPDRAQQRALAELLIVTQFTRGERLHSIDQTYLGEQPTRDAITHGIAYLHRQCTTGRIAIVPDHATVRVQSTLPIQVSAWNRNDGAMTLNRGIDWHVPYHLTLAPNGRRVTANEPGLAELRAAVIDRQASSLIEVPMESLAVSATQVTHTSWKLDGTSAPDGRPAPGPGAAPGWDGLPAHCDGVKTIAVTDSSINRTYTWTYIQQCWYSASASVTPPDGVHLSYYWWRWFDVGGYPIYAPTTKQPANAPADMASETEIAPFAGWGRLEVWGFNADSVPIAKGAVCISHCGGAP